MDNSSLVPSNFDQNRLDLAISFRTFGLVIAFYSLAVGTIGDGLTIFTIAINEKLRTTFNLFLLNLAIVDFWTACCQSFSISGYILIDWPFGRDSFTARLQAFNYFCCGYSSIVFLIAITVNRFVGAIAPGKYHTWFSKQRMVFILIFCNICAPIFLFPFLIATDDSCESPMNALTGFHQYQLLCTFVCLPNSWEDYELFVRVLFQFVPLVVMIVMYSIIFSYVRKKRSIMTNTMKKRPTTPSTVDSEVGGNLHAKPKTKRRQSRQVERRSAEESRLLIISVVICVGFMVTFIPSVVVSLVSKFYPKIDVRWQMAASNLAWLNCSLNPVIYVFLNRTFRKEYWKIFRSAYDSVRAKLSFCNRESPTTGNVVIQHSTTGNEVDILDDNKA